MGIGKIVLELPPGENNPRNSEGAFVNLKDGRVLFMYNHYTGTSYADEAKACLMVRYSEDMGETWSEEELFLSPDEFNAKNLMSPSFVRLSNGDLGLFFSIRYGWHDNRVRFFRSKDEGGTWSEPAKPIPALGYFVTNNDRVVRLSNGRLIVPAAYHRLKGDDVMARGSFDSRGLAMFFYSDDDGESWTEAQNYGVLECAYSKSGLQEPGVVELENGVLWSFCRTDIGRQYELFSIDGGTSWTTPMPSRFMSPCSPISVKRLPGNEGLFAVWNPVPANSTVENTNPGWGRTPLVCAVSRDDGKTWGKYKVLEDDEKRGFCYVAIHFIKDNVLLAYCAGGIDDGICLSRERVRKIPMQELLV